MTLRKFHSCPITCDFSSPKGNDWEFGTTADFFIVEERSPSPITIIKTIFTSFFRFTLKSFKSLFFVCRDLVLTAYKTSDAAARGVDPVMQVNLKGCEVTPEVNLSQHKYQVKLEIPSAEGMSEMWLRFDTVSQNHHQFL